MVEGPNLSSVKQFIADASATLSSAKKSIGTGFGNLSKVRMGTLKKPGFLKDGAAAVEKFFGEVDIKKSASEAYSAVKTKAAHAWKMATQRDNTQEKTDKSRRHSLPPDFGKVSSLGDFPTGNSANKTEEQPDVIVQWAPKSPNAPTTQSEAPRVPNRKTPDGPPPKLPTTSTDKSSTETASLRPLPTPPKKEEKIIGDKIVDFLSNEGVEEKAKAQSERETIEMEFDKHVSNYGTENKKNETEAESFNAIKNDLLDIGSNPQSVNSLREKIVGRLNHLSENNGDKEQIKRNKEYLQEIDNTLNEISQAIKERKNAVENDDEAGRKAGTAKMMSNYIKLPGAEYDESSGSVNTLAAGHFFDNFQEPTKLDY